MKVKRVILFAVVVIIGFMLGIYTGKAFSSEPIKAKGGRACMQKHNSNFCHVKADRHAVRILRTRIRWQEKRSNTPAVKLKPIRELTWNVLKSHRVNAWHRHLLKKLKSYPTWVVIRDPSSWACIHRYEAPRGWDELDNNGGVLYHGGLQMDQNFEEAYGRDMLAKYHGQGAEHWSEHDQLVVGQRGRDARGWQPWSTRFACGL